ncbi:MAG: hypothetical protein JST89_08480 [Cyanobacteria bacterium SZAS-4]|nr:hypothetical protein [Cyanobacteria bacterium SZAS-4]
MRSNFPRRTDKAKSRIVAFLAVFSVAQQTIFVSPVQSTNVQLTKKKSQLPFEYIPYISDVHSAGVSAEATQLAQQLKITDSLVELSKLKKARLADKNSLSREELDRYRDLREDVTETIEQTRLEVDFAQAELAREIAVHDELLAAYTADRNRKVNLSNAWGYRTNGVLWAAAEGLTIPTYAQPKYSISSGIVGIIAGLAPSAFSLYALRQDSGARFERKPHPNMLSKIFNYHVTPELEYPESVWTWLNSQAPAGPKVTRLEFMIDWWQKDGNIRYLSTKPSHSQLDLLTATVQDELTIQLISDRLAMLRTVEATILGMNRPLLELMMVVRGTKTIGSAQ